MPNTGHFILHSRAAPPLDAGDYRLQGTQHIAGGATEPYEAHLRITSPRFKLPPDQILSTFPPANSEGAYESRLPQIVLRRRTLPWERVMKSDDRTIPWLALVVIAEGEGEISKESNVSECVTPGVTLTGPNDVAAGVYLGVTQTVVSKVFPTAEDLQLLVHVREVDIDDTELAMGDDDGFLAVVMANRLPQFDRVNCKPVRYTACLINLEGQLAALPPPVQPVTIFHALAEVQNLTMATMPAFSTADHLVMGTGVLPATTVTQINRDAQAAPRAITSSPAQTAASAAPLTASTQAGGPVASSWANVSREVERVALTSAAEDAGRLVRDAMLINFRGPREWMVTEKTYRFPVLAHWSFTCTGAGSFESLMQGLDVGLLGTLPADAAARPKPDCAPPEKGSAPPAPPATRPDPELTETGHVGLDHTTRRGDSVRSWYRGPLTLHVTEREKPVLVHTSDQLRRVIPDGREDLTLAAAFEIGRLLALSQPSVVAALMRWRREQFGAARARKLSSMAVSDHAILRDSLKGTLADLGQLVGRQFVLDFGVNPAAKLGPQRPIVDPGRPIEYLQRADLDRIIATGFGFSYETVQKAGQETGFVNAFEAIAVPIAEGMRFDQTAAATLKAGLRDAVDRMTADVLAGKVTPVRGSSRKTSRKSSRDALDDLLDAAAAALEKKDVG